MLNKTETAPVATEPRNAESLTVAFQKFHGAFLAKISNLRGKETFAYGETKASAEHNALRNYHIKYANA